MARQNLEEARRSVLDLRTTPLAGKPLAEALAGLARDFTSGTGIPVSVHTSVELHELPLRTEAELFRIAQEALTNVARHSGARRVTIRLEGAPGSIRLSISDDGRGLGAVSGGGRGLGMIGMRARARSAGGDLSVQSAPGAGVVIEVRIPLHETHTHPAG
jgi:signal transduction histidine kinase